MAAEHKAAGRVAIKPVRQGRSAGKSEAQSIEIIL
jgi:hypothetical protein